MVICCRPSLLSLVTRQSSFSSLPFLLVCHTEYQRSLTMLPSTKDAAPHALYGLARRSGTPVMDRRTCSCTTQETHLLLSPFVWPSSALSFENDRNTETCYRKAWVVYIRSLYITFSLTSTRSFSISTCSSPVLGTTSGPSLLL